MKMENEEKNDSSQDRRSFFRKLVAVAAATGISGLLLGKLAEPVSASNIIPGSGKATFNGPVGIATTSPETLLHVSGSATSDVFCGLGPHPNMLINGQYVGPAMNYGYSGHSFGEGSGFFNVRPDAAATPPNPSLRFMTNNTQRMIIDNNGNVGIGTTSPLARAQVTAADTGTNSTLILDGSRTDNKNQILFRNSYWSTASDSYGLAAIRGIDSISSGGHLGFYTTANGGGTTGIPAERMRIDQAGNVGIGTAAPTSPLHVLGLPVYANNAAAIAGGLTAGAFYRTGANPDPVCVVH